MIIPGEPKGKGRPRFYNGHAVTPEGTREYEKLVSAAYISSGGKYYEGPIGIRIRAYFQIPKSVSKKSQCAMLTGAMKPTKRPDADNIAKIILDALNGVAYKDDSQVIDISVMKMYSAEARVEVEILEI